MFDVSLPTDMALVVSVGNVRTAQGAPAVVEGIIGTVVSGPGAVVAFKNPDGTVDSMKFIALTADDPDGDPAVGTVFQCDADADPGPGVTLLAPKQFMLHSTAVLAADYDLQLGTVIAKKDIIA